MVRFKNRYFVFEISTTDGHSPVEPLALNVKDVFYAILKATEKIHGEFGAAAVRNGLDVKYCNEYTRIGLVRSRHGPHRLIGSSLPFVSKIGERSVKLDSIYTGATMVKCFKFLQKYQKERLEDIIKKCKNDEQRRKIQKDIGAIMKFKLKKDQDD